MQEARTDADEDGGAGPTGDRQTDPTIWFGRAIHRIAARQRRCSRTLHFFQVALQLQVAEAFLSRPTYLDDVG